MAESAPPLRRRVVVVTPQNKRLSSSNQQQDEIRTDDLNKRLQTQHKLPMFFYGIIVVLIVCFLSSLFLIVRTFQRHNEDASHSFDDTKHYPHEKMSSLFGRRDDEAENKYRRLKETTLRLQKKKRQRRRASLPVNELARSNGTRNEQSPTTLKLRDFPDLEDESTGHDNDHDNDDPHFLDTILADAGVSLDDAMRRRLPRKSDVTRLYGSEPIVWGLETCSTFRRTVPPEDRFVGVGGLWNVGTNWLTRLLRANLHIPQNMQSFAGDGVGSTSTAFGTDDNDGASTSSGGSGIADQLPWNKHGWASMRGQAVLFPPFVDRIVMPVIVIRDAYFWMQSMCTTSYNLQWNRSSTIAQHHCPNLVRQQQQRASHANQSLSFDFEEHDGEPVSTTWARTYHRTWPSLAHVWSQWNQEYLEADFPRLMIRFEDLLFHAPVVMDKIRECVGATKKQDKFVYVTDPVKTASFFTQYKAHQTGLVSAMIRYGHDRHQQRRTKTMTAADRAYARSYLDARVMEAFGYQWPA